MNAIAVLREELAPLRTDLAPVLPAHITPEKFTAVCITAVENNPDLLNADRQSLKIACMNAATDGLLPDKREGAFVIFNTEVDVKRANSNATYKEKRKLVSWMPMITGILKKAYQTGKVQSISVELVYEHDQYSRSAGDNAEIVHVPLDFGDRGNVKGGYAIIRMKDGGDPYREVMSKDDIEKVRKASKNRSDSGPWVVFWEEMAKKTILRRALKRVPLSAELDTVLARDDVFYNLDAERRGQIEGMGPAAIARGQLFGNRVAKPARRGQLEAPAEEPAAETVTATADAPAEGQEGAETMDPRQQALAEAVQEILATTDRTGLAELIEAIKGREALADLTADERAWIDDAVQTKLGEFAPPFVLQAIISSSIGLKDYEDVELWKSDILAKMSALSGDALLVFWKANVDHVLDAGENGFDEAAERILDVAKNKKLPVEVR